MKIKIHPILLKLMKKISSLYIKYLTYTEEFTYHGKKIKLYEHSYNCGKLDVRMTDRSLELALAREWIATHRDNLVEIGAVTPYYLKGEISEIVDPSDPHRAVTVKDSLFHVNLRNKNVLSISTVEHVGLNDYGYTEGKNSMQAIKYIMENCKHCLITYPIGHNKKLDSWTKKNFQKPIFPKYKLVIYKRNMLDNNWKPCISVKEIPNCYGPLWANAVVVIEK